MMHHRTKRMSKVKNQRYHAKVRMLQHYDIQITNDDLEKMAEIYRHNPDVAILVKQSNRVVKAVIPYKGNCYPVVYDKKRHQIVTILKEEYLTSKQQRIFESCVFRLHNKESEIGAKVIPESLEVECNEEEEIIPQEEESVDDDYVEITESDANLMQEAFDRLLNF